jgi:uncharacterized protein (TIGR02996 family)
MITSSLKTALDACHRRDDGRALAALLDAWRASRADLIGDAVVALGPRAAREVPAPTGDSMLERGTAWREAAHSGEPCVMHHLLHSASEISDIRLLELGGNDPRPARALASLLAGRGLRRSAFAQIDRQITKVWRPLTELLVAARDGRALASLTAAVPLIVGRVPPARRADAADRIEAIVKAVRAACEPAPVLAPQDLALVEQILAYTRAPEPNAGGDAETEAALLADIYRAPADDGPRLIYADWLTERGTPRGEFIALQLRGRDRDRELASALLVSHVDEYLGPLAPHVAAVARFARGFVAQCTVKKEHAVEHPAWATVTEIVGGLPATDACPMPVLAKARELAAADLVRLASLAAPPPLATLELRATPADLPAIAAAYTAVAPRLAQLRAFGLHGLGATEPLAFALHGRPLESLEVTAPLETAAAWFAALAASEVRALVLHARAPRHMGSWTWLDSWLRIAREDAGWRLELVAVSGTKAHDIAHLIEHVIAPLVARVPRIAHFALYIPAQSEWRASTRTRITAVLDAHPALASRDLSARLAYRELF